MLVKTAFMAVFYFYFGMVNLKKIIFLGGDKRQKTAAEFLRNKNYGCDEFIETAPKNIKLAEYSAVILPLPTTRDGVFVNAPLMSDKIPLQKIIENLSENQLLITGNYTPQHSLFADINDDEEFAFLNAIPTAEGAIKILIESTSFTLWKSKILIVGNGKIGKLLANRLSAFGAEITVSARKNLDFSYIEAFGFETLHTNHLNEAMGKFDIVINTVPFPVITQREVEQSQNDCLFLELSSAPFGIDKQAVILSERNYIYAPALPGKTAPKTSGIFLGKTIHKILEKNLSNS